MKKEAKAQRVPRPASVHRCYICWKVDLSGRRLVCDKCLDERAPFCASVAKQVDREWCSYVSHHKRHARETQDGTPLACGAWCCVDHDPVQHCCVCGQHHAGAVGYAPGARGG